MLLPNSGHNDTNLHVSCGEGPVELVRVVRNYKILRQTADSRVNNQTKQPRRKTATLSTPAECLPITGKITGLRAAEHASKCVIKLQTSARKMTTDMYFYCKIVASAVESQQRRTVFASQPTRTRKYSDISEDKVASATSLYIGGCCRTWR